ncbi:acyl transferase/acyl hydrolase/lysophospholipase [Copromyces sp. CBS 386.78]|nr:acyl transferase/acyl hydrolase/lysophospholipase [Copromyces sp. CBS 386.78]
MKARGLRLLALDGGGIRGLSTLLILQKLMEEIDPVSPPKPCDYFDMIGGTSPGGLIAIMLGRLRMTIKDCIKAYLELADKVFKKKRHRISFFGKVQGRFDSEGLEEGIKKVLQEQNLDEDELLQDPKNGDCKVFVCATSKQDKEHCVCFTTYQSRRLAAHLYQSTTIWQACRATSAATTFFDPIAIGPFGEEFVDGALGNNNPVFQLWSQAQDVWGEHLENRLACLVSIGTGVPLPGAVGDRPGELVTMLTNLATETERTHEQFQSSHRNLLTNKQYYRFNARGMEFVERQESTKKKEIAAATGRYLALTDIGKNLEACAEKLASTAREESESLSVTRVMGLLEEAPAFSSMAWPMSSGTPARVLSQQTR